MPKILTMSYLFDLNPGSLHYSGFLFFVFFALIFVSLMVMFSIARKRKNNVYFKIWRSLNTFATTNLFLVLFFWFFAYEEIYIFSARFWWALWILGMIAWLFFIYKDFKKIPQIKEQLNKRKEFEKYIP